MVLAALPDLLDGALAKASNSASQRGAFFDSVIDRVTDALLLGGVAWYLASTESPTWRCCPSPSWRRRRIVSYERAKAESLGLYAKGGLMERAERIVLLCIGLLFESDPRFPILWVMLVLTVATAIQRFSRSGARPAWRLSSWSAGRPGGPGGSPAARRARCASTTSSSPPA